MVAFEVTCYLGRQISISENYWDLIITVKHPSMAQCEEQVKETLKNPEQIRRSKKDYTVYLYYKKYDEFHMVVVCKHLNGTGFIITTYRTDRIKEGEQIWKK